MGSLTIKSEFEKKLGELGLSYQGYPDNFYLLHHDNNVNRIYEAKLICSDQTDKLEYGSRNGNIVQSIGVFKFKISKADCEPDFYILGFASSNYQRTDFVIIPAEDFNRRLIKKSRYSTASHRISIVFWLMDDRFLYDCTGVGIEWEWFFLSGGLNQRMVDGSTWDYSEFQNDWKRLTLK
jgi:hypothetical protein